MYVVTSDSRPISSASGCFDHFDRLPQKGCRTPGPSGDEFSRLDHIFVGLGPPVRREGHTLQSKHVV